MYRHAKVNRCAAGKGDRSPKPPASWLASYRWAFCLGVVSMLANPNALAGDLPTVGTSMGEMYPDFLLPKVDSGSQAQREFGRLSDYRGKKVLLIHFASW